MTFLDLVRARESVRSYDPGRPVPRETIERILEAGRLAPSAVNRQPWRFLVVSSPEALARVRPAYGKQWFQDAPHILAVAGEPAAAWTRKYDGFNSHQMDLAIAMTHLLLAAEDEGVGTCWVSAFDPAVMRPALGLKEGEEVYAVTPLGYPPAGFAKKGTKERKPLAEVAEFV